jgi:glycosyltransferase involved in cell wall biosynthesis
LKIAIDIRTINKPRSGVGYYVTNLIKNLQKIDKENNYCLISNNGEYANTFHSQSNFENHRTCISNENHLVGDLWESFYLPRLLERKKVSVFHGPAFMVPLIRRNMGTVVTIHDIVSFIMPDTIPMKYAFYMRNLIKLVSRKADRIISVSQSTKNDLVKWLDVPDEKITVVHQAVSNSFRPATNGDGGAQMRRRFGINGRYMLFVGNLEPRKNLINLMEAFALARDRLGGPVQLVICGKKGWLYSGILKTCERIKRGNDIVITDYVNENDLLGLYQNAEMFVFPTRYEGFGMPALEAMACGTPVITSNTSSMPEITGSAAILISPSSVEEISEAMIKVANSDSLRKELREKGLKQAKLFSWTNTARETLDVYRSLA